MKTLVLSIKHGWTEQKEEEEESHSSILDIVSAVVKSSGDMIMDLNVLGLMTYYHYKCLLPSSAHIGHNYLI